MKFLRVLLLSVIIFCLFSHFAIKAKTEKEITDTIESVKEEIVTNEEEIVEETPAVKEIVEESPTIEEKTIEKKETSPLRIGDVLEEKNSYGIVKIGEKEVPIVAGDDKEELKSSAIAYYKSYVDRPVILGHNFKSVFLSLSYVEVGEKVLLTSIDGKENSYVVSESIWISETDYSDKSYQSNLLEDESYDLTLITCEHTSSSRGRRIVFCSLEDNI